MSPSGAQIRTCADSTWTILWKHSPPYLTMNSYDETGAPKGPFLSMFMEASKVCCDFKPPEMRYINIENSSQLITNRSLMSEGFVLMPETDPGYSECSVFAKDFLPLVESPGSLVFLKSSAIFSYINFVSVVLEAWPLAILLTLLCLMAAIGFWFTNYRKEPEKVSDNFFRGFWTGIYWAYTSVTSLGYGDITPISGSSRLLTFVWIIIGVVLSSVFTAALSAAFTTHALLTHQSFAGKTIGALQTDDDIVLAGSFQVNIKSFQSLSELLAGIENNKIDGVVLEALFSHSISFELAAKDLQLIREIQKLRHVGIRLFHPSEPFGHCMQDYFLWERTKFRQQFIDNIFPGSSILFVRSPGLATMRNILVILDGRRLGAIAGLWILLFLLLCCWQWAYGLDTLGFFRRKHRTGLTFKRNPYFMTATVIMKFFLCILVLGIIFIIIASPY